MSQTPVRISGDHLPSEGSSVSTSNQNTLVSQSLPPLIDTFGRVHNSLRISVTDACNIRCRYCMPETVNGFLPTHRLMPFESVYHFVRVLARSGLRKVRLTGGEPLMRPNLPALVEKLASIEGLEQIAMTTNGMMLREHISALVQAGLTHVNISLDTLHPETFEKISRRKGLDLVLDGIAAALETKLHIRLNALVLRDVNLDDCIPLVEFARDRNLWIRFIEFMPLDADRQWSQNSVVRGEEVRGLLEKKFGPMYPIARHEPSQPATDFQFADSRGGVGFIDPVSQPFCSSCNRLRLTADGKLRNCLFGREEWDVRSVIESGNSDEQIHAVAQQCVQNKYAAHGISTNGFTPPERAMYQIGG